LYEYQKKGLMKFAFCKLLILKDGVIDDQSGKNEKRALKEEKRDQGPALQMEFSTELIMTDYKEKSIGKRVPSLRTGD
jgi:hypothetical protein